MIPPASAGSPAQERPPHVPPPGGGAARVRRQPELRLAGPDAAGRPELECFIHECYARVHGADIRHYLPYLLAVQHSARETLGVLGYRPAREDRLFLEAYLGAPVEEVLSQRTGAAVRRSTIVEVGNLASATPGGARTLITFTTAYFKGAGLDWVVFTATPALRNSFTRLGIKLVALERATKERIADADRYWGRYYDAHPQVVGGNVRAGFHTLRHVLFSQSGRFETKALWCRAYRMGAAVREVMQAAVTPLQGLGT